MMMTGDEDIVRLVALLTRLLSMVDDRPAPLAGSSWQENARATIRQNVTAYLRGLRTNHDPGCPAGIAAVRRISGIRKGMADLGLFSPDDPVMTIADRIDTLAETIVRC